ncbi:MAG: hypothetical protein IPL84_02185 [Chitinophagaceae bacterium]|nr:hypothetical protein [Chitinophagaceae bacterium]
MQQQIASYLFQNKSCPLPGLGTLSIQQSGAVVDFSNKMIAAPKTIVHFTEKETDPAGLLSYLSAKTGGEFDDVVAAVDHFCDNLKNEIDRQQKVILENIGRFSVNGSGKIVFEQEELPPAFLQPVNAERVIHPDAEHQILVGDRETTNTVMTELLAPKEQTTDRWWIWAIVLGVVALLMLLIYFTELKGAMPFGNTIKI